MRNSAWGVVNPPPPPLFFITPVSAPLHLSPSYRAAIGGVVTGRDRPHPGVDDEELLGAGGALRGELAEGGRVGGRGAGDAFEGAGAAHALLPELGVQGGPGLGPGGQALRDERHGGGARVGGGRVRVRVAADPGRVAERAMGSACLFSLS